MLKLVVSAGKFARVENDSPASLERCTTNSDSLFELSTHVRRTCVFDIASAATKLAGKGARSGVVTLTGDEKSEDRLEKLAVACTRK